MITVENDVIGSDTVWILVLPYVYPFSCSGYRYGYEYGYAGY